MTVSLTVSGTVFWEDVLLTDVAVRKAKAAQKHYKMADGQGLYLLVTTTGGRSWRMDHRFNDKCRTVTFGLYPDVSLVDARKKRDAARKELSQGVDPGAEVEPPAPPAIRSSLALASDATSSSPPVLMAKAATRAAERLGIHQRELGEIIGISPATVSRAAHGGRLPEDGKAIELATLYVRTFHALDAIVGGDEAATWMRTQNTVLGGEPLALMKTVPGLVDCLAYLDAHRALD